MNNNIYYIRIIINPQILQKFELCHKIGLGHENPKSASAKFWTRSIPAAAGARQFFLKMAFLWLWITGENWDGGRTPSGSTSEGFAVEVLWSGADILLQQKKILPVFYFTEELLFSIVLPIVTMKIMPY